MVGVPDLHLRPMPERATLGRGAIECSAMDSAVVQPCRPEHVLAWTAVGVATFGTRAGCRSVRSDPGGSECRHARHRGAARPSTLRHRASGPHHHPVAEPRHRRTNHKATDTETSHTVWLGASWTAATLLYATPRQAFGRMRHRHSTRDASGHRCRLPHGRGCGITTVIWLRDGALLPVGFAGAFRRSELVGIEVRHLAISAEGVRTTLPRSKGDQEGAGEIVGVAPINGSQTCPVAVLEACGAPGRYSVTSATVSPATSLDRHCR